MRFILSEAFLRPRLKGLKAARRLAAFADAANWRMAKRLSATALAACAVVAPSGAGAEAASFDCAGKSLSTVEKLICSDGQLSVLDETLTRIYEVARASSPLPQTLKSAQREWIEGYRNESKTVAELTTEYKNRIDALNREIARIEAIRKQQPLNSDLGKKCLVNLAAQSAPASAQGVESKGRKEAPEPSCNVKYHRRSGFDTRLISSGLQTAFATRMLVNVGRALGSSLNPPNPACRSSASISSTRRGSPRPMASV